MTRRAFPPDDRQHRPHRRDIQGLRALAVGLVVVYHLRPGWLPGGFVGVDVFFVISGFLIIGLLTAEIRHTGRLGLLQFYARRIRRLLPAASVVLLTTVIGTVLLLPMSRWPSILREVAASALNVENWVLAVSSGNYAHATAAASPVQHFWSLSVEEQFYLVIPLVLLASAGFAGAALATGRWQVIRAIRYAFVAVALITAASLGFSVLFTPAHHDPAYFVTPTRIWELGVGGLAAMAVHGLRLGHAVRLVSGWGGLAAVLASAAVLSTDLAFPGWVALLPVLGTVALLVAGSVPADEPRRLTEVATPLGLWPLRYVGDISYSLYLWHWPVIVFTLQVTGGGRLSGYQALAAGVLALILASLSKHLVEDPFRRPRRRPKALQPAGTRPRLQLGGTYLVGATLLAATVAATIVPLRVAQRRLDALEAASVPAAGRPGVLALDAAHQMAAPDGAPLVPDPAVADRDVPLTDRPGCAVYDYLRNPASGEACSYGNPQAPWTIVLVGDSHAAQFSTALADLAKRDPRWRVKVMVRNGCPFSDVPPSDGGTPLTACSDQNRAEAAAILAMRPALVVTSAMSPESYLEDLHWTWPSRQRLVDGYRALLGPLSDAGIPIAVVREVPRPHTLVPPCLESHPDLPGACDTDRRTAFPADGDPLVEAATGLRGVTVVDLTPLLCTAEVCPAVIGNLVAYRDNHLTNTYVHALSVPLATALGLG